MTTSRIQITMAMPEGSANTTNSPAVSMNSVVDNLLVYPQFAVSEDDKEEKAAYNEEHPNVLAVKDTLLQICRKRLQHYDLSDLNLSLDDYVKQSLEHFIKECIEVISWLEKDSNNHSILYYANTLPACVKKATELLTKLDPTYLSNKTINLDKTFLKENKVDFTNIKKNMSGETLKNLQLTPSTTKVYLPTCYGYGDEDKEEGLYQQLFSTIKKYLNSGILPENIYVYFGPYEPVGYSIEEREIREEQVLQDLLLNTANYLRAQQINILIHKDKYKLFPTKGLTATDWVDSAEYKHATKVFYQLFANPKNADLHDNFRFDVISYLKPKFDKLKSKALVVLPEEKNRHASDAKPDCGHCIQTFEAMLMPVRLEIRLQMAVNAYIYNSIVAMLSQREESRFQAAPNNNPILPSENNVSDTMELKEEKNQLVVHVGSADHNQELNFDDILHGVGLSTFYLVHDLSMYNGLEHLSDTISKFTREIFSRIEHKAGLNNEQRLLMVSMVIKSFTEGTVAESKYCPSVISFITGNLDSSILNCFFNKILDNIAEYNLLQNPINLSFKTAIVKDILIQKSFLYPLEFEAEKFVKDFNETESRIHLELSDKRDILANQVRLTLKSITNIANAKSLLPSYRIYLPLFIKVITSPAFDGGKSFLFGFFKSSLRQDLLTEISDLVPESFTPALRQDRALDAKLHRAPTPDRTGAEIERHSIIKSLFRQHIEIPTIFDKDDINTALREKWITILTEEFNSLDKGGLTYELDSMTQERPWLDSVCYLQADVNGTQRYTSPIF